MPTTDRRWNQLMGQRRPLLIAAAVLVVAFAGVFLWRAVRQAASAQPHAPPPVEVTAVTARAETLPQALSANGSLQAVQQVVLAPEAPGRIVAIHFQAGQHAAAGAPLIQLFDAPERADRAAAVARQQFAQVQYDRSRELAPTGAEPRQLLQQREAELAQAKAAVLQLDARIAQKAVRAPFAGQVGLRRVNLGQYVNAGDAIATLTALDRLYVNFTVPQQQLARLRVGGEVSVRSDAAPGRVFPARINAIEPVVGGDTRNVSVQALMANPGQTLRPGVYVTVEVVQPARPGAVLLPTTAIQTSASGDSVFVVKGGRAMVVPVTVGAEVGDRTVVESGVRPGDVVVTTGQLRVQPGAPVKVAAAPSARR